MSKYIGSGATINKPKSGAINTHGKHCVIVAWEKDKGKYQVDFGDGWVGWYKRSELILDKDKTKMDNITEKDIKNTMNALVQSFDDELANQSQEDLEDYWFFEWDVEASDETNLYNFYDLLKLYGHHCRRWEEKHNGHICVVERVRDTYLKPKISEFIKLLSNKGKHE